MSIHSKTVIAVKIHSQLFVTAFSYASQVGSPVPFAIKPSPYTPNHVLALMKSAKKNEEPLILDQIDDYRWYSHCLLGFINNLPPTDIADRKDGKDVSQLLYFMPSIPSFAIKIISSQSKA